jgi:hypothetical protein
MSATNASTVTVGQQVICNGYDGTVTEVHTGQLNGMCTVRLARGTVCTGIAELLRFNREECRAASPHLAPVSRLAQLLKEDHENTCHS